MRTEEWNWLMILKKLVQFTIFNLERIFLRNVIRRLDTRVIIFIIQVEIAISPLSSNVNNSSGHLRTLRVLQQLISFTDPSLIAKNELVGKIIPCSLVLMFIFSYGPSEMQYPHEVSHEEEKGSLFLNVQYLQIYSFVSIHLPDSE